MNPNNETGMKLDIFPLDKFKFDIIFYWSQNAESFQYFYS